MLFHFCATVPSKWNVAKATLFCLVEVGEIFWTSCWRKLNFLFSQRVVVQYGTKFRAQHLVCEFKNFLPNSERIETSR